MKFADRVKSFLAKSLTDGEEKNEPDQNDDLESQEGAEGGESESMEKGLVDATDILGSLVTELKDVNKSLKVLTEKQSTLEKSQVDVGEAVVSVAEMVAKIAGTPVAPKTVMNKGNLGTGTQPAVLQPAAPPTQAEFEWAQRVLVKSVESGEISMQKSEMISSSLQKAMSIPGFKMNSEDYDFLNRKKAAGQ